ncbi:transcriptional protein SWT1 isoform X1 [Tachysurus vachellii]|uniref:transcriptional protein SWT1 isoform X1 n=1 Tax=Tachysurus vachellii TaxID=175792 RepID=UPI00296B3041|nr:transcriptional protein SWT1 isoform X1 [Tachysurus vachellii]XP_060738809.1 transcriptional protein SWT1 isoform X1 [Tachysurus vachellii]
MQAAAMPRKKTKTKKHKRERKKHRSSSSSCEDQGKDDSERRRGSQSDNNKRMRSNSTNGPQSRREIRANNETYTKSDVKIMKKSEGNKESHDSKHRAFHTSGKHSASQHYTSSTKKSSSNQIPEAPTRERREWRKSLGKEPGKRADKEEEKRKDLMKRKASQEDDYPVTKRRSASASCKEETDVRSRDRKKLVEAECRKSNEDRISGWKRSSLEKSPSRRSSKESKPPASAVTQNVRLKILTKGHSVSVCPTVSKESSSSLPSSSSPSPKISFKIPRKTSIVKAQTSKVCWENVKKSPVSSKSSPKTIDSSSVREQTRPKPTEVPSPVPSCSPPVQILQSSRTEETSEPCSNNALAEPAACFYVSAESIEPSDDYEMQIVEELHLARTNRQLHVNVEMSYGELTSMDVDPSDESTATTALGQKQQQQDRFIVLDTNILLSHLDFVRRIRSHGLGTLGFPTLLVPWVVLQELDSLKSGKLSKNVENKARPAVDYIYTSLKNQEPRLWGQSMQQMSQASCGLKSVNNDDRVLQCCLQYKALYPDGAIMLCTNDKNLCSKALLSGVKALSKADLQQQAELNPEHVHHHYDQTPAYPHAAPITQHQEAEKARRSREEVNVSRTKEPERELSECVSVLESSLQKALSAILEEEMKAAFGDLWLEIVYVKPPWSLDALLQCFRKHWIAVFGVIIRRSLIGCVETLSSFVRTDVSVERNTIVNTASVAEEFLTELRFRSPYGGHVDSALTCIKTLQHRLKAKPMKPPVDDRSGDTLMADAVQYVALPPQASHQEVWALFESIWNNLCHVSSAVFSALHFTPGSMDSVEPRSTPPPQDALSCLHRLNVALEQLLEAFQRLLTVGSSVDDAQALLSFIHTSEIVAMEPRFTAKDLFECLSHQEYREKLCIGGAQMMELRENLHRCAAAVCGTKT